MGLGLRLGLGLGLTLTLSTASAGRMLVLLEVLPIKLGFYLDPYP